MSGLLKRQNVCLLNREQVGSVVELRGVQAAVLSSKENRGSEEHLHLPKLSIFCN